MTKLAPLGLSASGPIPEGTVVPVDPIARIRAGNYLKVPVLAGNTWDEAKLFPTFLALAPALGGAGGHLVTDAHLFDIQFNYQPDAAPQIAVQQWIPSVYLPANRPVTGFNARTEFFNALFFGASRDNNVLKDGGSAADAAVAVQMVPGSVEPPSSGIGGGAFLMHCDAKTKKVQAYDGRETAPAAATENYLRYVGDTVASGTVLPNARSSGRAIGMPGAVRMLELVHTDHGNKRWAGLFDPAIKIATDGFRISGRMADAIAGAADNLKHDAEAAAYFLNADGSPRALGSTIKNSDYASSLQLIAQNGADALHTGVLAQAIVAKSGITGSANKGGPITAGLTTLADLANYQLKRRDAVCSTYRTSYTVCGMPPPSSGGIAVAQILGILENYNLAPLAPTAIDLEGGKPTVQGVHLVSEAERLADVDPNLYVADTDFVPLPGNGISSLLDMKYLKQRASLISLTSSLGTEQPSTFATTRSLGIGAPIAENGTSHVSIVDRDGNAVAMTTTLESSLGSYY